MPADVRFFAGERRAGPLKIRYNTVTPEYPVRRHQHARGHLTIVLGFATIVRGARRRGIWGLGCWWVPARDEHEIVARFRLPARYWCVGHRDF